YLKEQNYTVRQWNLINLENSDAWDCLAEIDEGGLIDIFVDVVIRNTTDKFDHFYDPPFLLFMYSNLFHLGSARKKGAAVFASHCSINHPSMKQ
ncbi:MAG: hypothetical protein EGR47_11975, partial [Clostridium sp.]|nr:hypothetical protein [Clostridium sp.]